MHKLLVAMVTDTACAVEPRTVAVKAVLKHHGFDILHTIPPVWCGQGDYLSKLLGFINIVQEAAAVGKYTHLCFVDARDVIFLVGPDEVMERYLTLGHPWVYAAEPFIWPPDSFEPDDYPPCDTPYRYLNGGASIGEVGHMLEQFNLRTDGGKALPTYLPKGEQGWLATLFLEGHPDAIKLDTGCELFMCLCGSRVGDEPYVTVSPGKVHNRVTGTDPLIVHFNGGDDVTAPGNRELWEHWFK